MVANDHVQYTQQTKFSSKTQKNHFLDLMKRINCPLIAEQIYFHVHALGHKAQIELSLGNFIENFVSHCSRIDK